MFFSEFVRGSLVFAFFAREAKLLDRVTIEGGLIPSITG
jgi:hypothetical protein